MISVEEALARLTAMAPPIAIEEASLDAAAGRWLAREVAALRTQPSRDLSAMDGYAVCFADLRREMKIIGESAAGKAFSGSVGEGEAVRIFTGAPLPVGADTVLVQEDAKRSGDRLTMIGEGPGTTGRHVRRAGLDFAVNETILSAGTRLTPQRLALAAIAGHASLPVRRTIRVAIAATGEELVAPGTASSPHQLPESNALMVAAMLRDLPVTIEQIGILPDRQDVLKTAFASVDADLLVTSGGASVGDHDLVRPALLASGGSIDFWKIAMRPGKPMLAGRLGDMLVLGLPGNPVAAFVTAMRFVRPLIATMAGGAMTPAARALPLGAPLPANDHRADHLRGQIRDGRVYPAELQDSSMLRTLAVSDCLILREPHSVAAAIGESVNILDIA